MKLNKNNVQIVSIIVAAVAIMLSMYSLLSGKSVLISGGETILSLAIALTGLVVVLYSLLIIKRINPKKYIYISYSSKNQELAEQLANILKNQFKQLSKYRFEVLTADSIPYGAVMHETMRENISKTDIVIVIVSEQYINSQWCIKELNAIMEKEKKIIPVVVNSFDDLLQMPNGIKDIKALSLIDCESEKDLEHRLTLLAKDLIKQRKD